MPTSGYVEYENFTAPYKVERSFDFGLTWETVEDDAKEFRYAGGDRPDSQSVPKTASGWRSPTSWSRNVVDSQVDPDCHQFHEDGTGFQIRATGPVSSGVLDPDSVWALYGDLQWMYDSVHSQALLALKGQGENASVDFAEWRQTSNMVANGAQSIASQVRNFRDSNPKDWSRVIRTEGSRLWREVPSRWLELQYGWVPLMSDINGACQDLSDRNDGSGYRKCVRGRVNDKWSYSNVRNTGFDTGQLYEELHYDITTHCELWYALDSGLLASLSSLGLTNPLDLVWETLKFSFVVDWFLPIGNWLSTFDANLGWNFLGGYTSDFGRVTGTNYLQPNDRVTGFSFPARHYFVRYRRTAHTSPPGAGVPHFKNPLSADHVANALSLLVQAFR